MLVGILVCMLVVAWYARERQQGRCKTCDRMRVRLMNVMGGFDGLFLFGWTTELHHLGRCC